MTNQQRIIKLEQEKQLSLTDWEALLASFTDEDAQFAAGHAQDIARRIFGNRIYFRGIIEFTNYCKNNCFYCGIRCGNHAVQRYRLTEEQILACCENGRALGFYTFVLQGGEDPYFDDERLAGIVKKIHSEYPECAVTLSVGERSRESYEKLFQAGATRYLLRHETADEAHYQKLHPAAMQWKNRMQCLQTLKNIGYQTGCGFMVGSPFQTVHSMALDMYYMAEFRPQMIGVGPFLPHHQTPFAQYAAGSVRTTLFIISLCRIMLPQVLLPATTALGTAQGNGRQQGVLAGANVIMPNLSPAQVRENYMLYDNKLKAKNDTAEDLFLLKQNMRDIGYELYEGKGDYTEGEAI